MKQPQRRFEVVDGRVSGHDDGDAPLQSLLKRSDEQRARFDRRAGDLQAIRSEEALKRAGGGEFRAKLRDERIVTVRRHPERSEGSPACCSGASEILRRLRGSG